jgi:hypothetical protein
LQSEIIESTRCGRRLFHSHCELQHELELVWHRQAELEENIRIENVRRHAVESGFVLNCTLQINLGECPLCLEDMSDPKIFRCYDPCRRYTCCGVAFCRACATQFGDKPLDAAKALIKAMFAGSVSEVHARQREHAILNRCPFCRAIVPNDEEELHRSVNGMGPNHGWFQP